jgi:hypothetical protein
VAGAALCLAWRWSPRVLPGRDLSPVGSTVASRTRSDAYCQYAENPAVADAVSHVVAAVVAENERVRRS